MPLTNSQTMSFFYGINNVAIGRYLVVKFQEEGIKDGGGLDMVDKDFLKQLTDNLKRPCGKINVSCAMVATPYFKFGSKLHMRL